MPNLKVRKGQASLWTAPGSGYLYPADLAAKVGLGGITAPTRPLDVSGVIGSDGLVLRPGLPDYNNNWISGCVKFGVDGDAPENWTIKSEYLAPFFYLGGGTTSLVVSYETTTIKYGVVSTEALRCTADNGLPLISASVPVRLVEATAWGNPPTSYGQLAYGGLDNKIYYSENQLETPIWAPLASESFVSGGYLALDGSNKMAAALPLYVKNDQSGPVGQLNDATVGLLTAGAEGDGTSYLKYVKRITTYDGKTAFYNYAWKKLLDEDASARFLSLDASGAATSPLPLFVTDVSQGSAPIGSIWYDSASGMYMGMRDAKPFPIAQALMWRPAHPTLGTLIAGDGNEWSILGSGSNGQVLTADDKELLGVKWAPGGGATTITNIRTFPGSAGSYTAFTTIASGAGPLTGKYNYGVVFVCEDGSSFVSKGYTSYPGYTASSASILLGNIPISDYPSVVARDVYRTVAGGDSYDLRFVGRISDNATTEFLDMVPDLGLGAGIPRTNTTAGNIYANDKIIFAADFDGGVRIGDGAGTGLSLQDVFIGANAGHSVTQYSHQNVAIGTYAMFNATAVAGNIAIGPGSLQLLIDGHRNTAVGLNAGFYGTNNWGNTYLGEWAGFNTTGSYNVFLGSNAGYDELGSYKLYIESNESYLHAPLIYGEFDTRKVILNSSGGLYVSGGIVASSISGISSSAMVSNFNAEFLGGTMASGFALAGHNHSGTYEPIISSGTSAQYWRGDKSWQALDKTAVGLGNVANTAQVTSVGATTPVSSTGGTTPSISMPKATSAADGYLASGDWVTFNNKASTAAFTSAANGLVPTPGASAGKFLRDDGTWASAGGGGGGVSSVGATAPVSSTGGATPSISIPVATSGANGYLASGDWQTFNGKQAALGFTPASTAVTISVTAPVTGGGDLSTNRTIGIQVATSAQNGYLSSADWQTFNNKGAGTVTSVGATSPVSSTGGATPSISIPVATSAANGYLSSADWQTFNGKQAAGNYVPYSGATGSISLGAYSLYSTSVTAASSYFSPGGLVVSNTSNGADSVALSGASISTTSGLANVAGVFAVGFYNGATSTSASMYGFIGQASVNNNSGSNKVVPNVVGAQALSYIIGDGHRVLNFSGIEVQTGFGGGMGPTVAVSSFGIHIKPLNTGTASLGNIAVSSNYGVMVEPFTVGNMALTNNYGLYIADQSALPGGTTVTNNYNIYSAGSGANYFGGAVSIAGSLKLTNGASAGYYLQSDASGNATWASAGAGTVTSVGATSPVSSTGGATPSISMPVATSAANGYLASGDWTTFNGKAPGWTNQASGLLWAGPATGSAATPSFRSLVVSDIPSLSATYSVTGHTHSGTYEPVISSGTSAQYWRGDKSWQTLDKSAVGLGNVANTAQVTSVGATAPVSSTGGTTPSISMPAATSAANGYLASGDWTTFNGKQSALGFTPASTAITIGVTSPVTGGGDLSTNRTIGIQVATSAQNGYLSSTDWQTFNNKGSGTVTSVGATSPVSSTGGATPSISMPAATSAANGYLASGDWITFNSKAGTAAFTSAANGLVPTPGASAGKYLRDDGSWQAAAGGSPVGATTELQYRAGSASFGAVSGSTVTSAGAISLGNTLTLNSANGTTKQLVIAATPGGQSSNLVEIYDTDVSLATYISANGVIFTGPLYGLSDSFRLGSLLQTGSAGRLTFSSGASAAVGVDTTITRQGAGVIQVGAGSGVNANGSLAVSAIIVSSTTTVANLNADTVDGVHASGFAPSTVFSSAANGLVPAPSSPANKFLRDDGTWQTAGGSSGTGSTQSGQATVDFGSSPIAIATTAVTGMAWVSPGSIIVTSVCDTGTADHEAGDASVEGVKAFVSGMTAGSGFMITCTTPGPTWGRYLVNWIAIA